MKTAVVTGAGRGLGRNIARELGARGYAVLCTDIDGAAAAETARLVGAGAWSMAQDVRDPQSHRRAAEEAAGRGALGVWVNNAGVLKTGLVWEIDEAEVRRHVDVNLLGVIWGSRAAVDAMSVDGGHIINVASMSSLVPAPGLAVYAGTKHAVLGFSLSLQGDLDGAGVPIRVSAPCPDAIDTDLVRENAADHQSAILFSAKKLLAADEVARRIAGLVDRPQLAPIYPRGRGVLAQVFRPFPGVGLRLLRQFVRAGERNRRRQSPG
ncbi:MAG TPA: SDR family oxidoreductase [Kofleriaceae bacterium]|nr:SDR family oxidoreductase [Kofleriaceae bacterium]